MAEINDLERLSDSDITELAIELNETKVFHIRHTIMSRFIQRYLIVDKNLLIIRLDRIEKSLSKQHFYELIWVYGACNFSLGYNMEYDTD